VAEIPIKRKDRRNAWPLLLGLLALILVLGFLFGRKRVDKAGFAADTTSSTTSTSNGAVADTSSRHP
jgi:LPXTG-motif cell wall-anchored protein